MPETEKPAFLVAPEADPVLIRIQGRASFQNSTCLRDFVKDEIRRGKRRFVVDFQHCSSMDSTFLGVLAGAALDLRRTQAPEASLVLTRVGQRNLELIRNLGLHRLLTVDAGGFPMQFAGGEEALACEEQPELDTARMALEAHENLVATDESNRAKFQDVMTFLKNRVAQS